MTVKQIVEDLAKAAVMTDADDLPALVNLQEQLRALSEAVDAEGVPALGEVAITAAELVEDIVLRQVEDEQASFALVQQTIDYAQQLVDAAENGQAAESLPRSPIESGGAEAAPSADEDEEILTAWINESEHSLAELEATIVEVDSADDPAELVAEIRRAVHTFKGEAGVLSLHVAQKLCHEAETLIDVRQEQQADFPVDELLALTDWMKSYVAALAADSQAAAPEHESLLDRLAGSETAAPTAAPVDAVAPPADEPAPASDTPTIDDPGGLVEFPAESEMDEMLNDFLCEAREHVASAEEAMLELEQDAEDLELINTVFRAFHTVKGVAGFLHLKPIVDLAHTSETLLDQLRTGGATLSAGHMDLILQSCDMLSQLVAALEGGQRPTKGQHGELIACLQRAIDGDVASAPKTDAPAAAAQSEFHPLGEILVDMMIATREEVEAALEAQRDGATKLRDMLLEAGITDVNGAEEALTNNSSTAGLVRNLLIDMGFATPKQLKDAIRAKQSSDKRIGELLNLSKKEIASALHEQRRARREDSEPAPASPEASTPAQAAPKPAASAAPAPAQAKSASARKKVDQTVKVNTSRMDNMVTMVGELVIAQQMVFQDPEIQALTDQRLQRNFTQVGKIIRDLQEVAMSLRMVTVKGVFQKMARLVRDISAKSGKKIVFQMEGEDTELDRNVVEEIGDPLVHMIRNSCDHGIESVADRVAAGKPGEGHLTLRAYHQGGSIIIEVEDDGRGLDRDKILAKAIERGVVSADRDPSEISDDEIYHLVFMPGFSTAEKVTDISGRGVGMDVVRRNIEALRGKVEINSTPGKGSTFRIRLPLTMAIIDGMVVRVGSQRYVVPTLAIEQSFRPVNDQIHTVVNRGEMAEVRGNLLPIYRLKQVFSLGEGHDELTDALLIVLESNHSRCCLMVDEILGQQQVVIKSLGQGINTIRGVSGGAILGDGRVALILDVGGLVDEATEITA